MCRALNRATAKDRDSCDRLRPELGAYLVGAISVQDRAKLVRHLASCERCRDELAGLAALPGLLHRAPGEPPAEDGRTG